MLLNTIRFEAVADGGDPFGPSPHLAPEPNEYAPEPEQQFAPEPEPEPQPEGALAEGEPTWDDEREQRFAQMEQFVGSMQEALEAAEAEQAEAAQRARFEQTGELPEFDPLDPANVTQHVAAQLSPWFQGIAQQQQQILDMMNEIQPFALGAAEQQGEELAGEVFDRLGKPVEEGGQGLGSFDRELALTMASLAQANGYDGEQALMQGALEAVRIGKRIRAEGAEEVLDHQQRVRGLRQEPGIGGPGAEHGEQEPTPHESRTAGRRPFRQAAVASLERQRARRSEAQ